MQPLPADIDADADDDDTGEIRRTLREIPKVDQRRETWRAR